MAGCAQVTRPFPVHGPHAFFAGEPAYFGHYETQWNRWPGDCGPDDVYQDHEPDEASSQGAELLPEPSTGVAPGLEGETPLDLPDMESLLESPSDSGVPSHDEDPMSPLDQVPGLPPPDQLPPFEPPAPPSQPMRDAAPSSPAVPFDDRMPPPGEDRSATTPPVRQPSTDAAPPPGPTPSEDLLPDDLFRDSPAPEPKKPDPLAPPAFPSLRNTLRQPGSAVIRTSGGAASTNTGQKPRPDRDERVGASRLTPVEGPGPALQRAPERLESGGRSHAAGRQPRTSRTKSAPADSVEKLEPRLIPANESADAVVPAEWTSTGQKPVRNDAAKPSGWRAKRSDAASAAATSHVRAATFEKPQADTSPQRSSSNPLRGNGGSIENPLR